MMRVSKFMVATALALAIAGLPVILDQCAESCDAHAVTASMTPPCHHAVPAGTHFTKAPTTCGHDHTGSAFTAVKNFAPTDRVFAMAASAARIVLIMPAPCDDARFALTTPPHASPPWFARSLPLRV